MTRLGFFLANTLLLKRVRSLVLLGVFHKYSFTLLCPGFLMFLTVELYCVIFILFSSLIFNIFLIMLPIC